MVRRDWSRLLAAAEEERRQQQRHDTTLRVGILHTGEGQELCVVKNISGGGLLARVYHKLDLHQRVWIELSGGERIAGRVAWCRGCDIGIEFATTIDVEEVLSSRWVNEDGMRPRAPRIGVSCPGRLQIGLRSYAVRLSDISEGGAKIEMRTPLKKLGPVVLTVPDLAPLPAYIHWIDDLRLGLGFEDRLPFEVLAEWLQERRRAAAPAADGLGRNRSAASG